MRKKRDLPEKICATCGRPFTWRRKWARDWEDVRHCSERCKRNKGKRQEPSPERRSQGSRSPT
ncbi:DUF2256 domain-containing protein [Roseibium sp. FZY0029]|uniref:DUF2256 domain-containing protein n=1 Tax=Roseibium sp. FZY0029 TaxID=3116647 RepID=UPI003FA6C271